MALLKALRSDGSESQPSTTRRAPARSRRTRHEEGDWHGIMRLASVRQLFVLCCCWLLGAWSTTDASPFYEWEDALVLRKLRDVQGEDVSDGLLSGRNEEDVQNVFKRFLFHYSKARNSVGAVQDESESVHPLMRLHPKLSHLRNKKVVLLKIRELPGGTL